MNRNKVLTGLLILLAAIAAVGGIFLLLSYGIDILDTIREFVTTTDAKKLAQCGSAMPAQFAAIKAQYGTLTAALYYGTPLVLVLVAVFMFLAGYFYNKGRYEDETKKKDEIEREMIRKAAERVARQKAKEAEAAANRAMEEELEQPQDNDETGEDYGGDETTTQMIVRKRRR